MAEQSPENAETSTVLPMLVVAKVLEVHTYVIDGPPNTIGVRCPCGFRNHGEHLTPERADRIARRHVAAHVVDALVIPPGATS